MLAAAGDARVLLAIEQHGIDPAEPRTQLAAALGDGRVACALCSKSSAASSTTRHAASASLASALSAPRQPGGSRAVNAGPAHARRPRQPCCCASIAIREPYRARRGSQRDHAGNRHHCHGRPPIHEPRDGGDEQRHRAVSTSCASVWSAHTHAAFRGRAPQRHHALRLVPGRPARARPYVWQQEAGPA